MNRISIGRDVNQTRQRCARFNIAYVLTTALRPDWQGLSLARSDLCVVLGHSVRRATIGSIPEAREAGITDATRAATPSNNVASINMTGSHGVTSNN